MAKVSVQLPEDLVEQFRKYYPKVSMSAVVQEAVRRRIEGETGTCTRCGQQLPSATQPQ